MKIVVLGAAGRTGIEVVEQALQSGHSVVAVVRSDKSLGIKNANLRVVVGDARDAKILKTALRGQDAVISTLGTNKAGDKLIAQSTTALIEAAGSSKVKRVIMMSSFLVSPQLKQSSLGKIVGLLMKGILADRMSGELALKESGLNWTIVYATALDRTPSGGKLRIIGSKETAGLNSGIARADVAKFMLDQLAEPKSYKKDILITTK